MMLFKPELREKILLGDKHQTRRPLNDCTLEGDTVYHANGRIKWQVGRDYAVQYGYGLPMAWYTRHPLPPKELSYEDYLVKRERYDTFGVWDLVMQANNYHPFRILITELWLEDVRNISSQDAEAEGFVNEVEFWEVWTSFYDKKANQLINEEAYHRDSLVKFLNPMRVGAELKTRSDKLYQGVAINFEVL